MPDNLSEFLLGGRDRRQRGIEQDGAGRGRALVDGEQVVGKLVPCGVLPVRWI
jgi:hypothetical protein